MAEFTRVANATWSPTKCVFCGDHEGPFIDAHLDLDAYGHVWICCSSASRSGCVWQIGRLDGMIVYEDMKEEIQRTQDTIEWLSSELNDAREDRVVPLADVVEMLSNREEVAFHGREED